MLCTFGQTRLTHACVLSILICYIHGYGFVSRVHFFQEGERRGPQFFAVLISKKDVLGCLMPFNNSVKRQHVLP